LGRDSFVVKFCYFAILLEENLQKHVFSVNNFFFFQQKVATFEKIRKLEKAVTGASQ
jgi:hypothetical protein